MRRRLFVCTIVPAAVLLLSPAALATGPGGWDHVGVGATSSTPSLNGVVTALNTQSPGALYVGGSFTSAGGRTRAKRVARWDGSTWSTIATTALGNGQVFALAAKAGKVYAGGSFINAGGDPNADFLAVWNGVSWAPVCTSTGPGPAITANVNALQIIGNTLYVGGAFQNGADIASADFLLACDLTTGTASSTVLADGDINSAVLALTADSNGTLYAGGAFSNLDGIADADHVASYDGAWHAMGTPSAVDSFVRSLTAVGTTVYVGTDSVNVAGIAQADHVARWNGAAWSAVGADGAGTNGWFPASSTIDALTTTGSLVVAAGSFQNANGTATADNVACFDGVRWRPIGSDGAGNGPFVGHATAVAIQAGKVYVGGNFTSAGGDPKAFSLAAYALRQPDAIIGATPSTHLVGNNVYSASGAHEVRAVTVRRGGHEASYVTVQNDGLVPASFGVHGQGGSTGITVRYFRGSTNVTSAVRAGTYDTGTIAARSSVVLRVVVKVAHTSAKAATFTTVLRSQAGVAPDAVRLNVAATG